MGYSVLIATPQNEKVQMITDALNQLEEELDFDLMVAETSFDLKEKTARMLPDLVILDTALELSKIVSLTEETILHYPNIHIIVLGQKMDPDEICLMSISNVDFFVPEPFESDLLLFYIRKAIRFIDIERAASSRMRYWRISGQIFLNHGRITNPENHLSVSLVNEMFGFHFIDDAYRMIVLNIDHGKTAVSAPSQENFDGLLKICADTLYHHIVPFCHESVLRISKKRIHMLLNYSEENDEELISMLRKWLNSLPHFITGNHHLSLCASKIHRSIQDIGIMAEESLDAAWLRFANKSASFITLDSGTHWPDFIREYFERLEKELQHASDTLDIDMFEEKLKELFIVPDRYFGLVETRYMMRRIENYFYETNRYLFASISNYEQTKQKIVRTVQLANSLDEYKHNWNNSLMTLFRILVSQTGGQQTKHVRIAKQYILSNLDLPLRLKDVAAIVNLNPAYLSACFKKETGCNFSDYVNQCRIEQAKFLLTNNNIKISEIAERLGYNGTRYFSRVFKNVTGFNPREFRNTLPRK